MIAPSDRRFPARSVRFTMRVVHRMSLIGDLVRPSDPSGIGEPAREAAMWEAYATRVEALDAASRLIARGIPPRFIAIGPYFRWYVIF